MNRDRRAWARASRAFGRFWWDFLVGDTPGVTVSVVVVVGLVALCRDVFDANVVAYGLLPLLIALTLFITVRRAQRRE